MSAATLVELSIVAAARLAGRYGKGRHRAALNLGDCFTYGLAIATGHPILCTGDDFPRTDAHVVDLSAS